MFFTTEITEATEEVVVLPAEEGVKLGLDLVELEAPSERDLPQLARLDGISFPPPSRPPKA